MGRVSEIIVGIRYMRLRIKGCWPILALASHPYLTFSLLVVPIKNITEVSTLT